MANSVFKISKKTATDGKSEVLIYITINRNKRIQIKSGVRVLPSCFSGEENTNGYRVGEIVKPNRGKYNLALVHEADKAKEELNKVNSYALRICDIIKDVTKENILNALHLINLENEERRIKNNGKSDELAPSSITTELLSNIRTREEEKASKEADEGKEKSIYEHAEMYLIKHDFSYDHTKAFRVLLRALHRYEMFIRANDDKYFMLTIEGMTKGIIEDFNDYLRNEYALANSKEYKALFKKILEVTPANLHTTRRTKKIEERGTNTIIKLNKKFKAFFNWLNEQGITTNKPFEGVKIGSEIYGVPYYLTISERDTLATAKMSNIALETQRDIFIFQCLTGCRVGDLMRLTPSNITDNILEYVPRKTKDENTESQVMPRVPLSKQAINLIEKYKGKDTQGRLFPFISAQKYNVAIKKALTEANITRKVNVRNATTGKTDIIPINEVASSHMARRTFVGSAYKEVHDANIVCKMSGHVEGSKAFNRYRTIDDDILKDVIDKIDKDKPKYDIQSIIENLSEEQKNELLKQLLNK